MHEKKDDGFTSKAERQASTPPLNRADFASALHRALRHYPQLERLETNPLLASRIVASRLRRSESPQTRAQTLREVIREQCEPWGNAPKIAILQRVLTLTYLDPMRSQQAVANTLNMSWSTYRRRLAEARELLANQLWQAECLLAEAPARRSEAKKTEEKTRPGKRRSRFAAATLVVTFVIAGVLVWHFGPWHGATGARAATPSIAVLPFENLSADKSNAYFAAGIQDEILTRLASIGSLKVISRTSTARYPSQPTNLSTIARQLGVTTLLEGSVQKVGDKVHINVQLIDARTQAHIWAKSYNRKLDNVFGVEGEVAQKIANALNAKLTTAEAHHLRKPLTRNPQAYDAFLRGHYYANRAYAGGTLADYDIAIKNYQQAVTADEGFALAYAKLSLAQLLKFHTLKHHGKLDSQLANEAKANFKKALEIEPALAAAHVAQGYYRDFVLRDNKGQLAAFKAALALDPDNSRTRLAIGIAYENRGLLKKTVQNLRVALAVDPRNIQILTSLARAYIWQRRYDDAASLLRRAQSISPNSAHVLLDLTRVYVRDTGDLDRALAAINAAPTGVQRNPAVLNKRAELEWARGNYATARTIFARLDKNAALPGWELQVEQGDLEWTAGNRDKARDHYEQAAKLIETSLETYPHSPVLHNYLGWIYARLGRGKKALEQMQATLKLEPAKKHPFPNMGVRLMLARVQAQLGHVDEAVDELRQLLEQPSGFVVSTALLRVNPKWDSIRHDPRFQALLRQYGQPASVARAAGTSP